MVNSKKCSLCLQIKPLQNFHQDKHNKDGHTARCSSCRNILENAYRNDKKNNTWQSRAKPKLTANQLRLNQNAGQRRRNKIRVFYTATQRARRFGVAIGKVSHKEINRLYSSPCFYCGSKDRISIDHVIPLALGGSHTIGNMVSCCQSCNSSKKSKLYIVWKMSEG